MNTQPPRSSYNEISSALQLDSARPKTPSQPELALLMRPQIQRALRGMFLQSLTNVFLRLTIRVVIIYIIQYIRMLKPQHQLSALDDNQENKIQAVPVFRPVPVVQPALAPVPTHVLQPNSQTITATPAPVPSAPPEVLRPNEQLVPEPIVNPNPEGVPIRPELALVPGHRPEIAALPELALRDTLALNGPLAAERVQNSAVPVPSAPQLPTQGPSVSPTQGPSNWSSVAAPASAHTLSNSAAFFAPQSRQAQVQPQLQPEPQVNLASILPFAKTLSADAPTPKPSASAAKDAHQQHDLFNNGPEKAPQSMFDNMFSASTKPSQLQSMFFNASGAEAAAQQIQPASRAAPCA